ncbi:MAG: hypothetical protein JOZ64_00940 [Solirubrobacterales bacterium]|nr:hypothetical protein [Solirubrobacterales bacterium]
MQRWTSQPLPVPRHPQAPYARADLELHDVEHDGPSYHALVYFNQADADENTGRAAPGYAGSFSVFAHGRCWGDRGHCDPPAEPLHPFDRRHLHPLTPINITVEVTRALRAVAGDTIAVTVLAFPALGSDRPAPLRFSRLTLVTYD